MIEVCEIVYRFETAYRFSAAMYIAAQENKEHVEIFKKKYSIKRLAKERALCQDGLLRIYCDDITRIIRLEYDGNKEDADIVFGTSGFAAKAKMKLTAPLVKFKRYSVENWRCDV